MTSGRCVVRWMLVILAFCTIALGSQNEKQAVTKNPSPSPPLSAQEIFKRVSSSVMVVESLDAKGKITAFGSGVVVMPPGARGPWDKYVADVVTNRHVIAEGITYRVEHKGKTWPAKLIRVDPNHDLAELSVDRLNAPAVHVRDSATLAVGEKVYAIGAPEGLELTISEGLISGLRDFENSRVIQTSAAISPGSSGGGLFDTQGQLVGITTFYLKEGQSLNFALPAEWTVALQSLPASSSPTPSENSPEMGALTWAEIGYKAYQAGEYQRASRAFQEAVRLKPNYAEAWADLGIVYNHLQQLDDAVKAELEAVRLKPDNEAAWITLGDAYGALRQYNGAINAEQQATRLSPSDGVAWRALGEAYIVAGHWDQAVGPLEEATKITPNDAKAWYALGLAYNATSRHLDAMKVYDRLKTIDLILAVELSKAIGLP